MTDAKTPRIYTYVSAPLAPTSLHLGTLISNPLLPTTDSISIGSPVWGQDCSRHEDTVITTLGVANLPVRPKHILARIFLGSETEKRTKELHVKAHYGFIYTLWTPRTWFNDLCSKAEVRKWLERTYAEKKEAFMVVGCKTIVDVQFVAKDKGNGGIEGKEEEEEEWEFPGERIYALELRKVEMKFFERTEGEVVIWGPMWESHSPVLAGEGEVEVVEARLEDSDGE